MGTWHDRSSAVRQSLLPTESSAQNRSRNRRLSPADAALLQFAAWAEIMKSDLCTEYAELGGVGPSGGGDARANEEFQGFIGRNQAYTLALQDLDGDMPQCITDNADDELSHADFITAFLRSRGRAGRPGTASDSPKQPGDWSATNKTHYQSYEPLTSYKSECQHHSHEF
jgi:hypothetical protein